MQKSKIEWCDYTINPVKGLCPMECPYCYARRMYKRFKWNPEIRFDASSLLLPIRTDWHKHAKFFVGSTIELFGDWVKPEWMESIFLTCRQCYEHTFIFLTKQPQNLIKWSPFPDNCWMGVSVTNTAQFMEAHKYLIPPLRAKVKLISFEPLLYPIAYPVVSKSRPYGYPLEVPLSECCNWVIIGAQTPYSEKTAPKIEWVREIIEAADRAKIPVFLKNNLKPLLANHWNDKSLVWEWINGYLSDMKIRQEFPNGYSISKR